MTHLALRQDLVKAGKRLLEEGLVARSWGNLSVRTGPTMLVTPSGIPWTDLTEEMIVEVDLETDAWSGDWKPSGERKVHREIYRRRPEVNAVAHTHQSAASVCAVARVSVTYEGRSIACAPYGLPGTKALTRGTVAALGDGPAVLMANHGVFTVGADLDQAFTRIRALEEACAALVAQANPGLPGPAHLPWSSQWMRPLEGNTGASWWSTAPFTVEWSRRGLPLKALLDDLAQLAGPRVRVVDDVPSGPTDVVLVRGRGALVSGPDAEALAMVVEKGARAALGSPGLGGAHAFPAWEAWLMRLVYAQSYAKQAAKVVKA